MFAHDQIMEPSKCQDNYVESTNFTEPTVKNDLLDLSKKSEVKITENTIDEVIFEENKETLKEEIKVTLKEESKQVNLEDIEDIDSNKPNENIEDVDNNKLYENIEDVFKNQNKENFMTDFPNHQTLNNEASHEKIRLIKHINKRPISYYSGCDDVFQLIDNISTTSTDISEVNSTNNHSSNTSTTPKETKTPRSCTPRFAFSPVPVAGLNDEFLKKLGKLRKSDSYAEKNNINESKSFINNKNIDESNSNMFIKLKSTKKKDTVNINSSTKEAITTENTLPTSIENSEPITLKSKLDIFNQKPIVAQKPRLLENSKINPNETIKTQLLDKPKLLNQKPVILKKPKLINETDINNNRNATDLNIKNTNEDNITLISENNSESLFDKNIENSLEKFKVDLGFPRNFYNKLNPIFSTTDKNNSNNNANIITPSQEKDFFTLEKDKNILHFDKKQPTESNQDVRLKETLTFLSKNPVVFKRKDDKNFSPTSQNIVATNKSIDKESTLDMLSCLEIKSLNYESKLKENDQSLSLINKIRADKIETTSNTWKVSLNKVEQKKSLKSPNSIGVPSFVTEFQQKKEVN